MYLVSKLKDLRIDNTLEINCTSIKFVLKKKLQVATYNFFYLLKWFTKNVVGFEIYSSKK